MLYVLQPLRCHIGLLQCRLLLERSTDSYWSSSTLKMGLLEGKEYKTLTTTPFSTLFVFCSNYFKVKGVSADDKILHCCLWFRDHVVKDPEEIALFSDDKNLCIKSMVHNIQSISWSDIEQISAQNPIITSIKQVVPPKSPVPKPLMHTSTISEKRKHDQIVIEEIKEPARKRVHVDSRTPIAQSPISSNKVLPIPMIVDSPLPVPAPAPAPVTITPHSLPTPMAIDSIVPVPLPQKQSLPVSIMQKPLPKSLPISVTQKPLPQSLPISIMQNPLPQSLPVSVMQKPLPQSLPISVMQNPLPQSLPVSVMQKPLPQSLPISVMPKPENRTAPKKIEIHLNLRAVELKTPSISHFYSSLENFEKELSQVCISHLVATLGDVTFSI